MSESSMEVVLLWLASGSLLSNELLADKWAEIVGGAFRWLALDESEFLLTPQCGCSLEGPLGPIPLPELFGFWFRICGTDGAWTGTGAAPLYGIPFPV